MINKYIKILSNPLLYYADKSGHSVFRNFSLFKQTGNMYNQTIAKSDVGKVLEYRFYLNKKLRFTNIISAIILYLIFIHTPFSIWNLLFFEFLWILCFIGAKLVCSYKYHRHLVQKFGNYSTIEFDPPINEEKYCEYLTGFKAKIIITVLLIAILFIPSILLNFGIKYSLTTKFGGFKRAIALSNIYNAFYPKREKIYDMRAYANYMLKNYDKALNDYKIALKLSGNDYSQKDLIRFGNLLLLKKKLSHAQDAVDLFNEYITTKNMSVFEQSQMLWIKSIFKIENHIPFTIAEEYNDLINSLDEKDTKNKFYISCDKAYMLYLLQQYDSALALYNELIIFAAQNDEYSKNLQALYAERGWTKRQLGQNIEANSDFLNSKIPINDLQDYEPAFSRQEFVKEKF